MSYWTLITGLIQKEGISMHSYSWHMTQPQIQSWRWQHGDVGSVSADIVGVVPTPANMLPTFPTKVTTEASFSNSQQQGHMSFHTGWQSDMIDNYLDQQGKQHWKCCHCGHEWSGWNHTKALKHLCGVVRGGIKFCSVLFFLSTGVASLTLQWKGTCIWGQKCKRWNHKHIFGQKGWYING